MSITAPVTDTLQHAVVSGVVHEGITVQTRDGRRARLAVIDDEGHIIEAGPAVEREVWEVAVQTYRNFWRGQGHLRVLSGARGGLSRDWPRDRTIRDDHQ